MIGRGFGHAIRIDTGIAHPHATERGFKPSPTGSFRGGAKTKPRYWSWFLTRRKDIPDDRAMPERRIRLARRRMPPAQDPREPTLDATAGRGTRRSGSLRQR